jgi:hypothetical protein
VYPASAFSVQTRRGAQVADEVFVRLPGDLRALREGQQTGDEKPDLPSGASMKLMRSVSLLLISATFPGLSIGQDASPADLQTILQLLETNREYYRSHIPTFFCSEHAVSRLDSGRHLEHKQVSVTDSVFHLTRVSAPNRDPDLIESRSEMKINGSPSSRTELQGPVVLSNVFSRGLDDVSVSQKGCASYSLAPASGNQGGDIQNIHFESIQGRLGSPECVFAEAVSGAVTFDKRVQQVTHINATIPHHLIARPDYYGQWNLSVEYGPVSLGGHTYWLPLRISSTLVPLEDDDAVWRFAATYSGFHKYEVESHILPSAGSVR